MIAKGFTEPTARIKALKAEVVNAVPEVEPYRAVLITESYKETEGMPAVMRRAKANEKIFNNLPVVINRRCSFRKTSFYKPLSRVLI